MHYYTNRNTMAYYSTEHKKIMSREKKYTQKGRGRVRKRKKQHRIQN
jgi:hypothetical protein